MSSFSTLFTDKIPLPTLLTDFVNWQQAFEYGQLGYYELEEEYDRNFWKYWIENGESVSEQVAEQFVLWIHLPEGSMIGFWRPAHFSDGDILPMVLIGSEGDTEVIADSLEDFLYKWADGCITDDVFDLEPEEDDARDELAEWLKKHEIQMPKVKKTVTSADLQHFFETVSQV